MAQNENIIDDINAFDECAPLVAGYSSANLANAAKALNSKDKAEAEKAQSMVPNKVKNLVKIIKKTVEKINANLKSKYPDMKPFSVENNVTYNAYGATGKVELIEAGNAQHLSFNIKKLTRLPGMEVTAIVTKAIVEAVAKENGKEHDNDFIKDLLDTKENEDDKKRAKAEGDAEKAKKVISGYLRNYLPALYSDDFEKFGAISDYVASIIVDGMDEAEIADILAPFFNMEASDISDLARDEVDKFLGKAHQARVSKLFAKAEDLLIDPENESVKVGYMQQAESLLGTDTSDPGYYDLAKKFETINGGEKCLTGPAVKEFCEYYVHNFLRANNVKDIEVTFEPKGALGSYYDLGGSKQKININLKKLQKIGSFTELAMTLSHELTHAVDSTKNKAAGRVNEDGTGLLNDIEEDISGSGATGKAKDLLVELKSFCYHINENERSARIGELSALIFMQKVGSKDPKIQQEIATSVAKYKKYQQKTIDMIQSLPVKIGEFEDRRKFLISTGELTEGSLANSMIVERITYLRDNGLTKDANGKEVPVSTLEEEESKLAADLIEKGDFEGLARLQEQQSQRKAQEDAAKKAQEDAAKKAAEGEQLEEGLQPGE